MAAKQENKTEKASAQLGVANEELMLDPSCLVGAAVSHLTDSSHSDADRV